MPATKSYCKSPIISQFILPRRVKIKEIAEELEIPYSVLDMVYNISSEIVSADE